MELPIVNSKSKSLEVPDSLFNQEVNDNLINQLINSYIDNGHQGTKAQKNRSQVSGGGAKPWRQKGTGRARAGTIRSPIWRSGGVTFAAKPQDHSQKVNRKMYRAGLRTILSELARQERLVVVEDFTLERPKTKALVAKLAEFNIKDAMIITKEVDRNLYLSARNLHKVEVVDVSGSDPVSLVAYDKVVITVAALKKFDEVLG